MPPVASPEAQVDIAAMAPRQQAAAALLAMEGEISRKILEQMDPEEATLLSLEMVRMPRLFPEQRRKLLELYGQQLAEETLALEGGSKAAIDFFGNIKELPSAKAALLSLQTEYSEKPFSALRALPKRIVKAVLVREHPQVVAMVVAYLSNETGREVMEALAPVERAEVALRVATMQDRPPLRQAIHQVEARLAEACEEVLSQELPPVGGVEAISDMLKGLPAAVKNGVLQSMEKLSPEVTKAIRKRLFTFEDLLALDDRGMQAVLKNVETRDLAMSLKAASPSMLEKVLKNLSERGGEMLQEEIEGLGNVRKKMVEDAQEKILAILSRLESEGTVTIEREG